MDLQEFFKNPSWISAVVIIIIFTYDFIKKRLEKKDEKKSKIIETEKQESAFATIDKLSDSVAMLIDKEINNVNLITGESIIASKLNESKLIIEREIRRIFANNHRENIQRQKIIKNALKSITLSVFENDVKVLSNVYFKSKKIADFLLNLDTEGFYKNLLELVFTTGGNPDSELNDIIFYLDSSFNNFILCGKKYLNNL